MGNTGL